MNIAGLESLIRRMYNGRRRRSTHLVPCGGSHPEKGGVYCSSREEAEAVLAEAQRSAPDPLWTIVELK